MSLIVLLPAYNEAGRIGGVIERIREAVPECEIVVVDDGSTDGTPDAARKASATVLCLPANQGYGVALQAGYVYAAEVGAEVVVQLDADGQHDPVSIPQLLAGLEDPGIGVVIGSRFLGEESYRVPFVRNVGQRFFRGILNLLTRSRYTDPTSGYQAIRGSVLWFFTSDAFPVDYPDADVLLMLWMAGIRVKEVPARFRASPPGKVSLHSGLRPFYYVFKMLFSLFLTLIRPRPLQRAGKGARSERSNRQEVNDECKSGS
jgi:glycosyltransferase involved in cell wall biosynthesis